MRESAIAVDEGELWNLINSFTRLTLCYTAPTQPPCSLLRIGVVNYKYLGRAALMDISQPPSSLLSWSADTTLIPQCLS